LTCATRLPRYVAQSHPAGGLVPARVLSPLVKEHRLALDLNAQGTANLGIARQVTLSGKTVSNYVSNILSKLQVVARAEAVVRAREAGTGIVTDCDTSR
jgi:DNA-binding NarL/FixJ family response regulator